MASSEEDSTAKTEIEINGQNQPKIIEWEELQQELARICSLSSALKKAKERKEALVDMIESIIQVREESLSWSNELEEMHMKLEEKNLAIENMLMHSKVRMEGNKTRTEQLSVAIRPLLVASKALYSATKQLQEASGLLAGDRGCMHLQNLQKMLRMRQQYMISQVSTLYPVKATACRDHANATLQNNVGKSGDGESELQLPVLSKANNLGMSSLTISGLQLAVPPLRKIGFFGDKKESQRSATALGYVAHVVSLVASYLDVPLRYNLRLGGSRSYIIDHAPSIESSPELAGPSATGVGTKRTEFPLFLEGQDTTRAAYAIFLLNKVLYMTGLPSASVPGGMQSQISHFMQEHRGFGLFATQCHIS